MICNTTTLLLHLSQMVITECMLSLGGVLQKEHHISSHGALK